MEDYSPPSQEELLEAHNELFCHTSAIPVQNRLRYLVENNPDPSKYDPSEYLDADELAFLLGKTEEEMYELIDDLNVPKGIMLKDKFGYPTLMPGMREVIEEELAWRDLCDGVDEFSVPLLAKYFDVKYDFIRNMAQKIGIDPRVLPNGSYLYPKGVAYRVRSEIMAFPPARNNMNIEDLVKDTGKSSFWIKPRLNPDFYSVSFDDITDLSIADFGEDLMRNERNLLNVHYGKNIIELVIRDAKRQAYVDSTTETIRSTARKIGRDYTWVETRTRKSQSDIAHGRVRIEEEARLLEESDWQRSLQPFSSDEMTVRQVARLMNVGHEIVESISRDIGVQPTERKTKNNRVARVYNYRDQLQIARGLCDRYEDSIVELECSLARGGLSAEESRMAKINLGRRRKLYAKAVNVYKKLAEQKEQVA